MRVRGADARVCVSGVCARVVCVRARADMYADTGVDGNTVAVAGMGVSVDANADRRRGVECRCGCGFRRGHRCQDKGRSRY